VHRAQRHGSVKGVMSERQRRSIAMTIAIEQGSMSVSKPSKQQTRAREDLQKDGVAGATPLCRVLCPCSLGWYGRRVLWSAFCGLVSHEGRDRSIRFALWFWSCLVLLFDKRWVYSHRATKSPSPDTYAVRQTRERGRRKDRSMTTAHVYVQDISHKSVSPRGQWHCCRSLKCGRAVLVLPATHPKSPLILPHHHHHHQ
jgi:hypothetical protein